MTIILFQYLVGR